MRTTRTRHLCACVSGRTPRTKWASSCCSSCRQTWPPSRALRSDIAKKALASDIAGYEKASADAPDDVQAHDALGVSYFQAGRMDDALAQFGTALRLKPDYAVANFNISLIEMLQGHFDEASAHLRKAIAVRPDYAEAHNNLGILLTRQGQVEPAAAEFHEVLRIHPDSSDAHYNLGRILLGTGKTEEAIVHLRAAIVTKPDVPSMLDDLSWILSTSPDDKIRNPKEAIALAEHAADLTGRRNASVLDTLGAAYAADGHFEQAAQVARQAFDLASDANSDEAGEFLKRLDLYRKGQPYREDAGLK